MQGARIVNRKKQPVHATHTGATYVYAYDLDGNVMELEQLTADQLGAAGYRGTRERDEENMWMSQVALVTHDRDRLIDFYAKVFAIRPSRIADVSDSAFFDDLFNLDDVRVKAGWFRLEGGSKTMEIFQFVDPQTPKFEGTRRPGDLGYSFSLEVTDIDAEYARLSALGVEFFSEPQQFGAFRQAFAGDIDGNIFALRQVLDPNSEYSVNH